MGRCHVFWVSLFFCFYYRSCPYPSLLFWSLFPLLIFVWNDLVFMMDFPLIRRWITKSDCLARRNHFWMGCACFTIRMNKRSMFPFSVAIVISTCLFRQSVRSCIIRGGPNSSTFNSSRKPVLVYPIYTFCCWSSRYFMAFCSDLASFPQSK